MLFSLTLCFLAGVRGCLYEPDFSYCLFNFALTTTLMTVVKHYGLYGLHRGKHLLGKYQPLTRFRKFKACRSDVSYGSPAQCITIPCRPAASHCQALIARHPAACPLQAAEIAKILPPAAPVLRRLKERTRRICICSTFQPQLRPP